MKKFDLQLDKWTPITILWENNEKLISKNFIEKLPTHISENLEETIKTASIILWKDSSYLKDFNLEETYHKVKKVLYETKEDIVLTNY